MFFNKSKSQYNILNDHDSEVFYLFMVVREQKEALEQEWMRTPYHDDLWDYWKTVCPTDPIIRAVRFLYYSNLGYLGKPQTLHFSLGNPQKLICERLDFTSEMLFGCKFMNCDFRDMLRRISFKDGDLETSFCYCDPPYLDAVNNYQSGFTKKDSEDLFDLMMSLPIKWAMSEFDHPFILDQARSRGLNVITVTERENLKNRRTEILVTNYENRNPDNELFPDNKLF